ncbi:MAG: DUF427 domain-containing protein [Anaerolineales bacterium]|nr:DUF427 domain-containing protein [Anaerolineales bacterium]
MINRIEPQVGQESVWDYPRPPRIELSPRRVRVIHQGIVIAESTRTRRILETSHPPTYYIPIDDIQLVYLVKNHHHTFCEYKGTASYWTLKINGQSVMNVGWSYEKPAQGYENLKHHIAFYPSRVDACYIDDEQVMAQQGDFYGGWITSDVVGPFKGGAGTWGW